MLGIRRDNIENQGIQFDARELPTTEQYSEDVLPTTIINKGVVTGVESDCIKGRSCDTGNACDTWAILGASRIIYNIIEGDFDIFTIGCGADCIIRDEGSNGPDFKGNGLVSSIVLAIRSDDMQVQSIWFDTVYQATGVENGEGVLTTAIVHQCVISPC